MVRRGQRRDLRRRRQHDLPDGPRARGRHPGLQLSRVDWIFGSDRGPRLLDRVGQALRGAGIDLRTDQVRPRLAQPVPAVHRRRPCDPGHGPREPRTADGTPLQPTRRADQSGRVRGGSLRERCNRPRGERLRGLGRHERPQRVRERILRRRPRLDRAVAGERGPREHERLAVDRRRRRGDRRPRLVRHRRPRRPGLLPVVVLGPHRRDGGPVGRVPGPGPAQLHGSGKLPDLPGPRDGAPDALRADLPGRARLHDEQRGPEHGGLLHRHRRRERMRVANAASLQPPAGSTGIVWLTRWTALSVGDGGETSYRIFYTGARSVSGGDPTFFSGTGTSASPKGIPGNGCVTTTPQNCKIIEYPAEHSESGNLDRAKGNFVIDVPLSHIGLPKAGDTLYSVTAFTFGEVSGNPLLLDVDATAAFDVTLSVGHGHGGHKGDGHGTVTDDSGNEARFSIFANDGQVGKVAFVDPTMGLVFQSAFIGSAVFDGTTATIEGTGFIAGAFGQFRIVLRDLANPGVGKDTFSIELSTGVKISGTITSGEIAIS